MAGAARAHSRKGRFTSLVTTVTPSAAQVVLASGRDGYTVVFSIGELTANRSNPRVFLVAESSEGPLPENQGPVRLIVYGDKARSAYGLAGIELKGLADNAKPARP